MKQLILENNGVISQLGGKPTSSELARRKAGYDFSVPPYRQPEYIPRPTSLRFLVLTLTDPADPLTHLHEIWDYAEANGIHDIYVLPDTDLIRGHYGFFTFLSLFPQRDDIRMHLCLTASVYNSLRYDDFQDLREMQTIALHSESAEAVREGSNIYLLPDDQSLDPEERAEMNSLEHSPSRLKGCRQQRYDYFLYESIHRMDCLWDDMIGAKYIFLKGWCNDLMLANDTHILLPVNGCVDVCADT